MEINLEEKELLKKAREGSLSAFEKIVSTYERGIFYYALRLLQKREDAEDIAQETFLKAYLNLKSYDPEKNFKTWIYTIANHNIMDLFRKRNIRKELYVVDDEESGFETIDESASYTNIDNAADLMAAMEKIKPAHKSILLLYYQSGFTYKEVASILEKPVNTIKTNLRRAKMALKKALLK